MGKKSLAGGTCGSGNFTLSPRYKVCKREGFYFLFLLLFIYLFMPKGFNQILMYCPKKEKKEEKEREPAVGHRMIGT